MNETAGLVYTTAADRLLAADLGKTYTDVALEAGVRYYFSVWSGGGSNALWHFLEVTDSPNDSPAASTIHSIVGTDNLDDSTVGSKITIVTGTAVHIGSQQVTFAANGDITLPQRSRPYVLKWFGGFDFDGDPDQEARVSFSGTTLYSLDATADAFDTTAEGASDDNGTNITFAAFQWMRPTAFAVIDASAGPVTTSLTFTEGGADVGPTGGTIEITSN